MEKAQPPTDLQLTAALGPRRALWDELLRVLTREFAPVAEEWVYSGKNYGWSLRVKQKKRAILYLTPGDKMVRAGFALGEKAAVAAETSGLPARVLQLIDNAPRYAEGRGVRLELEDLGDVGIVLTLAQIKMSH